MRSEEPVESVIESSEYGNAFWVSVSGWTWVSWKLKIERLVNNELTSSVKGEHNPMPSKGPCSMLPTCKVSASARAAATPLTLIPRPRSDPASRRHPLHHCCPFVACRVSRVASCVPCRRRGGVARVTASSVWRPRNKQQAPLSSYRYHRLSPPRVADRRSRRLLGVVSTPHVDVRYPSI